MLSLAIEVIMNILTQLLQIITLKRRPQDIDYDEFSALLYVAIVIGLGYFINTLSAIYSKPFQYSLVQNIAFVITLYGVLAINKKQSRFIQTCTALFGVSAIVQFVSLSSVYIPVLKYFSYFLTGWLIYLTILVLRESLETNTIAALLVLISINILSIVPLVTLYPSFMQDIVTFYEAVQKQQ